MDDLDRILSRPSTVFDFSIPNEYWEWAFFGDYE